MRSRIFTPCAAWLCAMLVLAGCADRAAGPAAPAAVPLASGASAAELVATTYRLGSGDRIKLTVFRHEDLSGEFALDGAGKARALDVGTLLRLRPVALIHVFDTAIQLRCELHDRAVRRGELMRQHFLQRAVGLDRIREV